MTLSLVPTIASASASAVAATGLTLIVVRPDHDRSRSAGIVGVLAGAVGAATVIHYALMDRRLGRMEDLGQRIVSCERDVLHALQSREDGAEAAGSDLLG